MIHCFVLLTVLSVGQSAAVKAPALRGQPVTRARQLANLRGLKLAEGVYFISPVNWRADIDTQNVYLQSPRQNVIVKEGSEIAAWRFKKAEDKQPVIRMPDYTGQTWQSVTKAIGQSQLKLMNDRESTPDAAIVTGQFPRPGATVYAGNSVFLQTKSSK